MGCSGLCKCSIVRNMSLPSLVAPDQSDAKRTCIQIRLQDAYSNRLKAKTDLT